MSVSNETHSLPFFANGASVIETTTHQQPATTYRLYGDGIMMSYDDCNPAYHLCGDCIKLMEEFLFPIVIAGEK